MTKSQKANRAVKRKRAKEKALKKSVKMNIQGAAKRLALWEDAKLHASVGIPVAPVKHTAI